VEGEFCELRTNGVLGSSPPEIATCHTKIRHSSLLEVAIQYYSDVGGIKPIETRYRGYRFRSRLEARWAVFFDVAGVAWQYEPEGFDLTNVRVPRVYDPNGPDLPPVRVWNEPEDMKVYAPLWYLPDFYLPEQEYWVEVKPIFPTEREILLMRRLVMATGKDGYIFYDTTTPSEQIDDREERLPWFTGIVMVSYERVPLSWYHDPDRPGRAQFLDPDFAENDPYYYVAVGNSGFHWSQCPRCGALEITLRGDARFMKCGCLGYPDRYTWINASPEHTLDLVLSNRGPLYTYDLPQLTSAYMAARQARFEHKESPDSIGSPLRAALTQERLRAADLESKLHRIRELLDTDNAT
jgi:hypothetical protein